MIVGGASSAWADGAIDLFHETFGNNSGSARPWDDSYSVKSGVLAVYSGITGYTVSNAKQGKNTTGSTQSGLNQSSQGTDAYIIIGPLKVDGYSDLTLTYQWKAASIKGTYSTKLEYATSSGGEYTEVSGTGTGATGFVVRSYSLPAAAQVSTLYLKITWNTSNTQAIIDEVNLSGVAAPVTHTLTYSATNGTIAGVDASSNAVASGGSIAESATVTLTATPSSGYAFKEWSVSGTGSTLSSTSTNPTTFTMGTADATVTAVFVESSTVATPSFSVSEGTYNVAQSVELDCGTDGATIYYTTDGTNPTTSSSVYSKAISVTQTTTIKAFAVKDGLTNSAIGSATYTLKCVAPSFDPAAGSVGYGTAVTLSTTTDGATIYYTTNGDTPTSSSSTYDSSNKPTVTGDQTFKAIATKTGWSNSDVSSAAYTYYYVITAVSNNDSYGTVSGTTTITAVPKNGYRVVAGDGGYTVTSGTATVTNNGDNTFTVEAASNCTVQINFEAIPTHTVTFSVNGNTTRKTSVQEDAVITFPTAVETPADAMEFPKEMYGMTFVGWNSSSYTHATDAPAYVNTSTTTMGTSDVTYYAVYAERTSGTLTTVTDDLTLSKTGVSGTSYTSWSGKSVSSDAVYAGCNAGGNNSIQLNASTSSSKRGIVSTTTGGKIKSVSVEWNSNSNTSRSLTVYGSNSAYENVSAFNSSMGTSLGSITKGTSTSLDVTGNYTYIGLYATEAIYLDKVSITWETGTPDTYSNFCTTFSSLPRPVITMADVEMTWGDTDKSVAPTATVGEAAYEGTFTFTSSDADNLTVGIDGKLTCNVPGTYTVTASIDATAEHQAASVDCTVTVGKKDATLTFAEPTVQKLIAAETYAQAATKTPAEAGAVTYSITPSGNAVNVSTGAVTLTNTGNYTVTATAAENTLYNEATASYTLQVRTTPTIVAEDKTIAYGETFTVDDDVIEGGVITVVPSNTAIATASGLVLTSAAVGSTVVAVRTAADDTYIAGEETFTLTVTAPEALSEKPSADPVIVFYESFKTNSGTGGNDGSWSGTIASSSLTSDNEWTFENGNGADECAKFGTKNNGGSATTPALTLESDVTYKLTFKAAAWNGSSENTTLSLTATNATLDKYSVTLEKGAWTNYEVTVTNAGNEATFKFSTSTGNSRFFLDEVKITKPGVDIATVPVTVSTSRYATYCCQYPLDLSALDSKVKAYTVTAVTADAVTFTKITGTVKGGVPFILYGTPGNYDLTVAASSSTVPDGNKLVGTLAPTFVEQEVGGYTNFALSAAHGDFRKIKENGMVVPANKVYLPVQSSLLGGSARMAIIFDDDETTTVQGVAVRKDVPATYYNLKGQRVENPVKGQLYIVNGKKVVMK